MKNLKSKQWFNLTGCTFQTLLKKLWQWHWRCNPRSWSLLLKPFLWERKIKHVSQKSGSAAHGSQNQTSDDSPVVFKYRIEQCGCSTIWRLVQLPKPYWSQWNVDENVKTQIGCSVPAQMDHKGQIECSSPVSVLFSVHLRKNIYIHNVDESCACLHFWLMLGLSTSGGVPGALPELQLISRLLGFVTLEEMAASGYGHHAPAEFPPLPSSDFLRFLSQISRNFHIGSLQPYT